MNRKFILLIPRIMKRETTCATILDAQSRLINRWAEKPQTKSFMLEHHETENRFQCYFTGSAKTLAYINMGVSTRESQTYSSIHLPSLQKKESEF